MWICSNGTHLSHQEMVVVYVNSDKITSTRNGSFDMEYFDYVKKFAENVLAFTKLLVESFDENEKIRTDPSCSMQCQNNCTNTAKKDA